jgi:hypothetical protein
VFEPYATGSPDKFSTQKRRTERMTKPALADTKVPAWVSKLRLCNRARDLAQGLEHASHYLLDAALQITGCDLDEHWYHFESAVFYFFGR